MPVSSETCSRIEEALLRYVHDESCAETELAAVMATLGSMDPGDLRIVEALFIERHADHVMARFLAQLAPSEPPRAPMDTLGEILQLWRNVVMPSQLVPILTRGGIDAMKRTFAAVVRDAVDWTPIAQALTLGALHDRVPTLRALSEAGLDEEANAVLAQRLPQEISDYVNACFARRYDAHAHRHIEQWLQNELIVDVQLVLEPQASPNCMVPRDAMFALARKSLAQLRIQELYHIVATGNAQGLDDLRQTLTTPELRNEAVVSFSKQCRERLLNGGADTVDIIHMYLQTIQGFSLLDPQGVLLERVSEPIQHMLKERADTSAVIAEGLFGTPSSSLAFLSQELEKQPQVHVVPKGCSGFDEWTPDPVDAPADFVKKQAADSVATLINLYDNKEVFVKQFAALYSNELLNASFDTSSSVTLSRLEQHYLHLAQRFGESHLHKIGVMLNDMRYSHEIAARIHESHPELRKISGVVLSRLYWPALNVNGGGTSLHLPASVKQQIEAYAERYQSIEGHEALALEWLPNHGRVSLEVELKDRKLDLVVEPEQAVLISAFGHSSEQTLALTDLLELTQLEEPTLLAAIQFWVSQGVIGTSGEEYKILETQDEVTAQAQSHTQIVTSTALGNNPSRKPAKDPFEDMQVYWSYIKGMLTNLGALPLEKIHSFLVLFVPNEDPYVKTKQELESYLLAMVDDEQLQMEDGKYALAKK